MEGFTYNNIFDTKGIEYLIIIVFLVLIIPFWYLINRRKGSKIITRSVTGILTSHILKIPQGLYLNGNHTWTHLEKSGIALIGLDDFLLHVTGEIKLRNLNSPGKIIKRGELIAEIDQNGKQLQVYSPVSGRIMKTNTLLYDTPGILNEDPYGKGWIYKIQPTQWIEETGSCFLSDKATDWLGRELDRFKDFLAVSMIRYSPENSMIILQDGGELQDHPLSELPDVVWKDFQKTFLN
jgi:glycine cleavage system H protein